MKFPKPIPVTEIADRIQAKLLGDKSLFATGINEIHKVEPGDINFSDVPKYFKKSLESAATIIILNEEVECPPGKAILVCNEPFEAYNSLVKAYRPFIPNTAHVSDTAMIHPSAIIEPGVVISHHVEIGPDCHIQANVYLGEYSKIGARVNIQAGAIIGTDAFYYKKKEDGFHKWRSGGRVIIEDDVEIGAGCTINKGVSGDTIIGEGSKLDCQIHIGHGAVIGKRCLFAAQVGVGGKTIIEDEVVLYGQVGVIHNIRIGAKAIVLAGSGVKKPLAGGKTYFGAPAEEIGIKYRQLAALKQLPAFLREEK